MFKLTKPDENDPDLGQSRLLNALHPTIRYVEEHGGIGLTETNAFNRKFSHWAADNFDWPEYSIDKQLSTQQVLEPRRVCRRLQLLSMVEHHEQNNEQGLP